MTVLDETGSASPGESTTPPQVARLSALDRRHRPDYHGEKDELMIQVQNISDEPVTVERGERLAQGSL